MTDQKVGEQRMSVALRGKRRGTKTRGEPAPRSVEPQQRAGSMDVAPRRAGAAARTEKKSKAPRRERNPGAGPHVLHTRSLSHYLGRPALLPHTHSVTACMLTQTCTPVI